MPRITLNIIEKIYAFSKKVYSKEMRLEQAVDFFEKTYNMNENSMADYIYAFKHLMDGELYTRTISFDGTKYYLENILNDFGIEKFQNAIKSLKLHINYYENLTSTTMRGQRQLLEELENTDSSEIVYPDEITKKEKNVLEGSKKKVTVNVYERDSQARERCIEEYGYICKICEFDFEKIYGEVGKDFIHVHHLIPLSEIRKEYRVDPLKDLIPVCPNCHAMLHRRIPAYTPVDVVNFINSIK